VNILVDTSVWSLALRRDYPPDCKAVYPLKAALKNGEHVFTTGLIIQELLQGFKGPKARQRIIENFAPLPLIVPERKDHINAADLMVKLRHKGIQAGTIDVLLAQLCLRHGLSLLSTDRDFIHIAKHVPLALIAI
jgi:predicted nucleic acid-binding protein